MNEFRIHKVFAVLLSGGHFCTYSHPSGAGALRHLNLKNKPVVIVDGHKLESLREYARFIDPNVNEFYYCLFQKLEQSILGSGSGPIAPCFDDIDYRYESMRGKWFVLYERDWNEIVKIFQTK
jgi:hypothetical protein